MNAGRSLRLPSALRWRLRARGRRRRRRAGRGWRSNPRERSGSSGRGSRVYPAPRALCPPLTSGPNEAEDRAVLAPAAAGRLCGSGWSSRARRQPTTSRRPPWRMLEQLTPADHPPDRGARTARGRVQRRATLTGDRRLLARRDRSISRSSVIVSNVSTPVTCRRPLDVARAARNPFPLDCPRERSHNGRCPAGRWRGPGCTPTRRDAPSCQGPPDPTDEGEAREGLRQSTVGWTRHAFRPPPLPRQPFSPLSSDLHA